MSPTNKAREDDSDSEPDLASDDMREVNENSQFDFNYKQDQENRL
jgi:hypothetical protein